VLLDVDGERQLRAQPLDLGEALCVPLRALG
jgi:hypothetical protein